MAGNFKKRQIKYVPRNIGNKKQFEALVIIRLYAVNKVPGLRARLIIDATNTNHKVFYDVVLKDKVVLMQCTTSSEKGNSFRCIQRLVHSDTGDADEFMYKLFKMMNQKMGGFSVEPTGMHYQPFCMRENSAKFFSNSDMNQGWPLNISEDQFEKRIFDEIDLKISPKKIPRNKESVVALMFNSKPYIDKLN